ncbi:MAG: hypothetical protein MJ188_10935 [Treponema sp.]|nr:hypothetical protein [Treponema sp.]
MNKNRRKTAKIFIFSLICTFFSIFIISCKTSPKRVMEITLVRDSAIEMLENANAGILSGDYEKAEGFLIKAFSQAMSIDNYDLLTSVSLAYVSLYLSNNPPNKAEAYKYLEKANLFAKYSTNPELNLSLCVLSEIRINLNAETNTDYNQLLTLLKQNEGAVKKDLYSYAQFQSTYGDIYRKQEKYQLAIQNYQEAIKVFKEECYLSELGITCYKLAQVNSLSGNKKTALEAIDEAINYDRAAENTLALGTDYYAKGLILTKTNPSKTDEDLAKYCFEHSADIFLATGKDLENLAERSLKAAENLK